MKRGLITWDKGALPAAAFESRLGRVRAALAERDLPALVVYSDVWRSNQARFLTNFMPYWNRSLAVIPREDPPLLLCGLSPRVYPWIRSVTVFEEIRPAGKLAQSLMQLCAERQWSRIGVLDLALLPLEIHSGLQNAVDVPSGGLCDPDEGELAMRRKAVHLAREILTEQLPRGAGKSDYEFAGRLEREFRRAGAEDLALLFSSGQTVPAPAKGEILGQRYSVAVAVEYCGHWAKVTRAQASESARELLRDRFEAALRNGGGRVEDLSSPYPYRMGRGPVFALHVESQRLYYGDTCMGAQLL